MRGYPVAVTKQRALQDRQVLPPRTLYRYVSKPARYGAGQEFEQP